MPGCLLEIDLTGYVSRPGLEAGPIGEDRPARAFRVGDLVFVSGRSAVDATGAIPPEASLHPEFPVYGSDIKLQTRYVLGRLAEDLSTAGSSLAEVAKATVFLADLKRFSAFEEVWREHFPTPPARTVVCTPGLTRPGALVEIDVIASLG